MQVISKFLSKENKIVLLSALGGSFEFYNYMIYIIFAPLISQLFMPLSDKLVSLIGVYAISGLSYFSRPLGGMLFSHFGDRDGRKKTFIYSISLMAISTFLIGVLPTYNQIGVASSLLLIFLILLQGLSVGGETPGAITFASEHAGEKKRGMTCGIIIAFLNIGILIGMAINFLLAATLTQAQLLSWGWRLPFIFGGAMGVMAIYLRKKMTESPLFLQYQQEKQRDTLPIITVLKEYKPQIIQGIAITWLGSLVINLFYVYLPTYLTTILSYSAEQVTLLNTLNLVFYSLLIIVMGVASDKFGRRKVLFAGSFGLALFGYGIYSALLGYSGVHLVGAMVVMSVLSACVATYPSMLVDLFPISIRYSGIALTFNLGAILGGLSPLIVTALINVTGNLLAPSFYLMASAGVCIIVIVASRRRVRLSYA